LDESIVIQGYAALQERFKRLGHVDEKLLRLIGDAAVYEAKLRVPRRTGNLGRSIGRTTVGTTSVRIAARANYAGFVEFGTRAHEITPRAKRALAWAGGGGARLTGSPRKGAAMTFAMRVHHPGTKPHPYLLPGARAAIERSNLKGVIFEAWDNE
jgi:hypothetical protein